MTAIEPPVIDTLLALCVAIDPKPKLVLEVVALATSDKLFDEFNGVYVKAVVTSLDVNVIAPVRVLKAVTLPALLNAAGSQALPSHIQRALPTVFQ